ncbi:hypothetical protein NDA11_006277 [Ustilago hordei]|uniref:Arrestin C-terminal-like domain-containing protein n=1 Tax=Ustilago hordei TaxID=120017 RepID=I2G4X1_USTHO|nr:uncharacterized protein UHO2_01371 [Ustilago hordei]KAJ1044686.1 hypothetical protein NDA10_001240 [Ustilago hordei]KAJ1583802.1 hypothetical protein NDA15_006894 [Ustilago hordei]KAJ1586816.1 hypothetical protein NDA11_006277 [Ustilago hordei]KAJ1592208.1 hypothetical protein NDA12_006529 [Ustilago hordei]UTT94703.1 hypothetical protein NDA17_000220 [Ustilago hordei]
MFSTFFQPCELKLHLLQNAVFLHPPDRPLPDTHVRPPMANDEIIRGLVELYVPSTRHISGIRVRLKAVQTIAILDPASGLTPISWEDSTVFEKHVEIGIQSDKEKHHHNHHHLLSFNHRSASAGPAHNGASSSYSQARGRSSAAPDHQGRSGSAFGMRSHSPGGSIPASMARAVSRGRKLASGMSRVSHSPSPSNSQPASRASSPSAPALSERGRPATRAPPTYAYAISEACQNGGTPTASFGQQVVDHSLPASRVGTPQRSRRPSLSNGHTPPDERGGQPPAETDALAAQLQRSLAVHARNDRRSASATPLEQSSSSSSLSGLHAHHAEEDKGKAKSRSASIGFFGSRKARSKSRAQATRRASGHLSDLLQVDEEGGRGRSAAERPPLEPSGSSGGIVVTPGSENDSGWEYEPAQDGLELQKGVHGFEFAFIIPCDAPPYERSPYGRVRYIIKATAIGAGRAKSNVECWRDLYPMVNPSPDSGPTPLTVLYNDMHPTVGLVSIACTSNNISVGGVFNIDVNSPNPPNDLIVYLVRVSLETTIELTTKRKGKQTVPVQRHKLFEKGWVPPKNNDGSHGDGKKTDGFVRNSGTDHAWTVQGIARMPDDNHIRASTVAASKAAINFSHVMVVEIVHSRKPAGSTASTPEEEAKERRLKVFALRQPVLIPSCCCAYDAVTLPAYSADPDPGARRAEMPYDLSNFAHHPPSANDEGNAVVAAAAAGTSGLKTFTSGGLNGANTATPVSGQSQLFCVCGMSLQDLSAQERALIPSQPLDVMDGELFRHQGKIGELPPRLDATGGGSRRRSPSTSSTAAGIAASLKGRRRSTSSTRTTTSGANAVAGSSSGSALAERRGSITASIKGRSPSIASALRARRPSNSSSSSYAGGIGLGRGESASRGSAVSRISASSNIMAAQAVQQQQQREGSIPPQAASAGAAGTTSTGDDVRRIPE